MTTPAAQHEQLVNAGRITHDAPQVHAIAELQRVHGALIAAGPLPRGWRRRFARLLPGRRRQVLGVFLWGPVGRGKTFLMDLFYNSLPFADKRRQHFHRFMNSVHGDLKKFRRHSDPLELVADHVAESTRVICFDEFAVADIADAMILGNLFGALFRRGVTLVATSNLQPSELYRDGLQRQRFLPAIELIETNTIRVHLDGPLDYRLRVLERADVYQYPINQETEKKLAEYFSAIAPDESVKDAQIELLGRQITSRREADSIIWFDFVEICDGPRNQSDYIELARCYQTVLISNVPQFTPMMENQARRFIALVDEFYDRKVKLILSAAVPLDQLYAGNRLRFEFQRTKSRLQEMQSHDYLAATHLP